MKNLKSTKKQKNLTKDITFYRGNFISSQILRIVENILITLFKFALTY